MTTRKILAGLALGLALFASSLLAPAPVHAAGLVMCSPDVSGGVQGPRRVVNTSSTAATQPAYVLNSAGCGYIAQADIGFFLSQAFTFGPGYGGFIYTTGVAAGTTDFVIGNLPANAFVQMVIYNNATANAVTGGITIGSTANASDVSTATVCAANCLAQATDAQLVKRAWSTTAATALHAAAVTAWNSANLTITVIYGYF